MHWRAFGIAAGMMVGMFVVACILALFIKVFGPYPLLALLVAAAFYVLYTELK